MQVTITITDPDSETLAHLFAALTPPVPRVAAKPTPVITGVTEAASEADPVASEAAPIKRGRGRPRKVVAEPAPSLTIDEVRPQVERALGLVGGHRLRELFVQLAGGPCTKLSELPAQHYPELINRLDAMLAEDDVA